MAESGKQPRVRKARAPEKAAESEVARPICLALQGGGAHGAYTWGVLDRLIEDERLLIDGVSGTSAGAMNGAILAYGMGQGGRPGARQLLREFWTRVAVAGKFSIFQPTIFDRMSGRHDFPYSPAYQAFDLMSRLFSPYQFPLNANPLQLVLEDLIDFDRLRQTNGVKLFVNTTNVRTGKIRVFYPHELTADVLLASSALPHLFRAVEIDGEHYWDGGFMGNPAIFPLLYNCRASDLFLVSINPMHVEEVPTTAREIIDRMNCISFNATMMRELRTIALFTELLDQHRLSGRSNMRRINFHVVQADSEMEKFGAASKSNLDWDFLTALFELGRTTASQWLESKFDSIGVCSTVDMRKMFF